MKKMGIITFDIIREKESSIAFSVASLLTYLKTRKEYGETYQVQHLPINLYENPNQNINWSSIANIDWHGFDFIAISCYVWSHRQSITLMSWLKQKKVKAKIIAGGYQINVRNNGALRKLYPEVDIFILGYAEKALHNLLTIAGQTDIIQEKIDFREIPSPFINGTIPINKQTTRIRLETKRGCPYACTFCAQHELDQRKVNYYLEDRLLPELEYLHKFFPERINVTDPVFNMGNTYIPYLEEIKYLGMKGVFNFQVRPELVSGERGEKFLDLIAETDSQIELGIQTFDEEVNTVIKRGNNYMAINKTLCALLDRGINFGVSLIYGLPKQTLKSFEKDMNKMKAMGVKNLVAYPLSLLPGTDLYNQSQTFYHKEIILGDYGIPHVVESSTFTYSDWQKMHELAQSVNQSGRLF